MGPWLQYWLFYAQNAQDRGIVHTGRHAGDWEMVQLRLAHGAPVEAVYAQHSGAERCGWDDVRHEGGHPVVYVANGSHASYF
ncbi:MAG: Vps62-related protein, partial [Solirubrobacteraceae bacterium]